jgi:hypothetical protein
MEDRTKKVLSWLIGLALVAALGGVAACTSSSDDDESTETETSDTNGDETDDDESDDAASDPSDPELEDGAIAISKAYFGQFAEVDSSEVDFAVAVMVEDSEGNWWARVTATPDDPSMETEQIYVKLEPGNEVWFTIDMGTGIDPATDDRFPEDVQDELQP